MKRLLMLVLFGMFALSCETALDCAVSDPPEIEQRDLPNGQLFNAYSETINLTGNSDYTWQDFNVEGTVPNGLQCTGNGDDIFVNGTPTLLGDFDFTVKIRVKHDDEESNGCEYTISQQFSIHVD